ncbi:TIGR02302 family protein [Sneathiella sp.]|jgi:uncharacterized protein (TIGR02302 family)|uniref:TIGR02302 family protein n=1 Tax=Sneathiella sp. TaxID=1964365 RepID=UPI0039E3CBBB
MRTPPNEFETQLKRKLFLVTLNLVLERLWVASLFFVCTILCFLGVSYAGLWTLVTGIYHAAGLGCFLVASIYGYYRIWRDFHWPTKEEVLRCLEERNAVRHRPLRTLAQPKRTDTLRDKKSNSLWRAHLKRQRVLSKALKPGFARLGLAEGDRMAFRVASILILSAGFFMAGSQKSERIIGAFTPQFVSENDLVDLDMWVTPPDYTGKAPILLARQKTTEIGTQIPVIVVPENSRLIARVSGGSDGVPSVAYQGERQDFTNVEGNNFTLETTLTESDFLTVEKNGESLGQWQLDIVYDQEPTVKILALPQVTERLAFRLQYSAFDDYGLMGLEGQLSRAGFEKRIPLKLTLVAGSKEVEGKSYHDLTAHPWAGLEVDLQLIAEDAAGQVGFSDTLSFVLPERIFTHPIARALIEQRKKLVEDPIGNKRTVVIALSAISQLPESLNNDITVMLLLSIARGTLAYGADQGAVDEVIDILWDTALRLENGDLSAAEIALREAERALMEALNSDADNDEIKRLVEDLKKAMAAFLEALAQQNQSDPQMAQDPSEPTMSQQNLEDLLDKIDQFARSGARDAARELLSELQDLFENLKSARQNVASDAQKQGQEMLDQLSEMMRRQQELLDETFRKSREGNSAQQGQAPSRSQPGEGKEPGQGKGQQQGEPRSYDGLARSQEALRQMLGDIMGKLGLNAEIPAPLGKAERAMNSARQSLEQGAGKGAMQSQSDALQMLKEAGEGLAQQMQEQGRGGQVVRRGSTTGQSDPFGDPGNSILENLSGRTNIDGNALMRAKIIQRELQKRLSDPRRDLLETEYLKRLIEQF